MAPVRVPYLIVVDCSSSCRNVVVLEETILLDSTTWQRKCNDGSCCVPPSSFFGSPTIDGRWTDRITLPTKNKSFFFVVIINEECLAHAIKLKLSALGVSFGAKSLAVQ